MLAILPVLALIILALAYALEAVARCQAAGRSLDQIDLSRTWALLRRASARMAALQQADIAQAAALCAENPAADFVAEAAAMPARAGAAQDGGAPWMPSWRRPVRPRTAHDHFAAPRFAGRCHPPWRPAGDRRSKMGSGAGVNGCP